MHKSFVPSSGTEDGVGGATWLAQDGVGVEVAEPDRAVETEVAGTMSHFRRNCPRAATRIALGPARIHK
jgi:hypothetical protein